MNFSDLVSQVNILSNVLSSHQAQMMHDANYNKDGSFNKAPFFSKRGRLFETEAAFTMAENYLANMGDPRGIHIATDRVAYNGFMIPVNVPYRDIIVEDLTNDINRSYQAKACRSADASLKAALNPKYIDSGVIPLVPADQASQISTIGGIKVGGKVITSDPRTLEELNSLTSFYERGGYIYPDFRIYP